MICGRMTIEFVYSVAPPRSRCCRQRFRYLGSISARYSAASTPCQKVLCVYPLQTSHEVLRPGSSAGLPFSECPPLCFGVCVCVCACLLNVGIWGLVWGLGWSVFSATYRYGARPGRSCYPLCRDLRRHCQQAEIERLTKLTSCLSYAGESILCSGASLLGLRSRCIDAPQSSFGLPFVDLTSP